MSGGTFIIPTLYPPILRIMLLFSKEKWLNFCVPPNNKKRHNPHWMKPPYSWINHPSGCCSCISVFHENLKSYNTQSTTTDNCARNFSFICWRLRLARIAWYCIRLMPPYVFFWISELFFKGALNNIKK